MQDKGLNLFYSNTQFPSAKKVKSIKFAKLENSSTFFQSVKKRSLLSAFPLKTKSNLRKIRTMRKDSFTTQKRNYNLSKNELLDRTSSKENKKSSAAQIMRSLLLF